MSWIKSESYLKSTIAAGVLGAVRQKLTTARNTTNRGNSTQSFSHLEGLIATVELLPEYMGAGP